MNRSSRSGYWLMVVLGLVLVLPGCRSSRPDTRLQGTVVDPQNRPVAGVLVEVPGRPAVTTGSGGQFVVRGVAAVDRLPVSFQARGYVSTTRILIASSSNVVVIRPRAPEQALDAAIGGQVGFQGLPGGIVLPAGGLVDDRGQPATGQARARLTYLDVSDPEQLATAPGDFTARMRDGSTQQLESYGIFEISVTDAVGRRLDLAPGTTAEIELPIPRSFVDRAPEATRLFSFDRVAGRWVEEGRLIRTGLIYRGSINRLDWSWNADDPLDTTCMTFRVTRPFAPGNPPEPNCLVEAEGVTYGSVSQGYTNAQGLVCLLVKKNAQVEIQASSTLVSNYVSVPVTVTSPNFPAGANDCGDPEKCPLTEIGLDIITGDGRL
jgi:Carboxypeptidase regulatory-like domain